MSNNFFDQSTSDDYQDSYVKGLKDNIFLAMELSSMSYSDVMAMPVHRLDDFLDWKIRYDQEKEKAKSNSLDQISL